MATAAKSQADQVFELLNDLKGRVAKIEPVAEAFTKAANTAAKGSGYSPQEFFARATDGGRVPAMVAADGTMVPVALNRRTQKSMGRKKNYETGADVNFGDFLQHFANFKTKGLAAEGSVDFLTKAGMYGARDMDGAIIKTALAESSGVTGGYGVPPMFAEQLLTLAVEKEVIGNRASKQPLTSRTLQLPSLDMTTAFGAGITPFLGGVQATWTSEASTLSESEPKLRQTELTAWQLSFFLIASNTLLADNAVSLDTLITSLMSQAIGWYRDYAYINGNGVGKPLGIQNAGATVQVTKAIAAHFTFYDVAAMLAKMIYTEPDNLCWIIHPSVIQDLYRMNDMSSVNNSGVGQGRVLFVPWNEGAQAAIPRSGPQTFGKLAGYDVYVSEKLPALGTTGCVMLVDPSKYLVGERQDLQIDVSPHVYFTSNQLVWRVIYRGDGQPWLNNAITLADGTYTVTPFTILTQ